MKKREAWLNPPGAGDADMSKRTLTKLYNENPSWLQDVHHKLNEAVLAAYGWKGSLSDNEILTRLLHLNGERFAKKADHAKVAVSYQTADPDQEPKKAPASVRGVTDKKRIPSS